MGLPVTINTTTVCYAYHRLIHLSKQRKDNLYAAQTVEGIAHVARGALDRAWKAQGVHVASYGPRRASRGDNT